MFRLGKPKVITDGAAISAALERGVENVFPNADAVDKRLRSGKRLTLYLGVDPTGPTMHLGHAIQLRKLGQFQRLGHKVIFLIGDFTAMIGDPTDKSAARKKLTRAEVLANCKRYRQQASLFIDFSGPNAAELKFNSKWLSKLSFVDVVELASHMTVDQMLKRDMFERRMAEGKPIHMHEFLYPLMQGYDSVAMGVDGEVGGNDQTFNMLAGRDLSRAISGTDKFVVATRLLVDAGGKKMGKTEGNMVALDQSASEIFGKVMSWPDGLIAGGFELLTDVPLEQIETIKAKMSGGLNPRDFKAHLAEEVAALVRGRAEAARARAQFFSTFKEGAVPEDAPKISARKGDKLSDLLVKAKIVSSKSEFRRLIDGKAVSYVGGEEIADYEYMIARSGTVRVGKKRFVTIEAR